MEPITPEIVEPIKLIENNGELVPRDEKGRLLPGHPGISPGRPLGSKNKFTLVKEALVDAFLDADGAEAFKNTLVYEDGVEGKKKKYINLEALRSVLRVLPREDVTSGNTYNFNLIVKELRELGPEELRAIIARRPRNDGAGSGEGISAS